MSIWEISFEPDKFQYLVIPESEGMNWIDLFRGIPLVKSWNPVHVSISQDNDKVTGDFPSVNVRLQA